MALCHFRSLEALFLDENQFTGGLPPCIADLTELSQFYVFKNQLYGEIPTEYSVLLELGKSKTAPLFYCLAAFPLSHHFSV